MGRSIDREATRCRQDQRWIEGGRRSERPELRLFCFHGAGGGAYAFRTWSRGLPAFVDICPIQLPGRQTRIGESPFRRMGALATSIANALAGELDLPAAFFGHSMGALVAFEVARELRRRSQRAPLTLVVAARGAPHLPPALPDIHHLPDHELLAAVSARYDSIPAELMREAELLQLVLPALRADLELHETHVHLVEPKLDVPLLALGGDADVSVPRARLESWREHTLGPFTMHMLPGGHYFHQAEEAEVLRLLSSHLSAVREILQ